MCVFIHIYMYVYIYIHIFFFRFFSIIGYYKILNIVPCTFCDIQVLRVRMSLRVTTTSGQVVQASRGLLTYLALEKPPKFIH